MENTKEVKQKKQIDEKIREKLREPIPTEAITQHPTKSFLSTIKAIYVVERLNDVFGIGRWDLKTEIVLAEEGYVLMKGKLILLDYDAEIPVQYGGHNTSGKGTEIADGYKSAITDCLSKTASYLEIGIDVFKGKAKSKEFGIKKTIESIKKTNEVNKNSSESIKTCPFCKKEHQGRYPKCIKCFIKEKNGEKLVKKETKTIINNEVKPF